MKSMICFAAFLAGFFFLTPANAQGKKSKNNTAEKAEAYQKVLKIIESGKFEFDAGKANPQRGRQVDLTTNPGYLKVNNGQVEADLPYMGVAHTAPYSGDTGIKFDGQATGYKIDKNDKKNRVTVTFKISSKGESFNCSLTVTGNPDSAVLYINSTRRDSISYYGRISETKE